MPAKGSRGGAASANKTTPTDASRIQSTQVSMSPSSPPTFSATPPAFGRLATALPAPKSPTVTSPPTLSRARSAPFSVSAKAGNDSSKGSFPARAQAAAAKNAAGGPSPPNSKGKAPKA